MIGIIKPSYNWFFICFFQYFGLCIHTHNYISIVNNFDRHIHKKTFQETNNIFQKFSSYHISLLLNVFTTN